MSLNINNNNKNESAMDSNIDALPAPMPLLPNQPQHGMYEDRVASASNRQLTDEEKWRLQEEQWARDEQARYGSAAASAHAGLGDLRSTSDIEMAVPFNSPSGASNNNSLRNPNGLVDDSAPMDPQRFGKLRNYYDRSGPSNTMASDLAGIQHQQQQFQEGQQLPRNEQFSQQQFQEKQQLPLNADIQQFQGQQFQQPQPIQQLYDQEQQHRELDQQLHQQALLDQHHIQNQPLHDRQFQGQPHHEQLKRHDEMLLNDQPLSHHHQKRPLEEEQQPLLQHHSKGDQWQGQQSLQQRGQLEQQQQQLNQRNFVDPTLNLNNDAPASYYNNNASNNAKSITSGNASTKSLINEDGIAPYAHSIREAEKSEGLSAESRIAASASTIVANTIRANHNFDEHNIVEHHEIMAVEGERYNAVAEVAGIPIRIEDGGQNGADLASPTAFLDDAQILEEKAKMMELERRIAERNQSYEERIRQDELKKERSKELGLVAIGPGAPVTTQQQKQTETFDRIVNEPWDENATGDNFVSMGKPRSSKINDEGLSPSAQRARELEQQRSAGIPEAEAKKKDNSPKEVIDAMKAQLNMAPRIKPEDGIPLGAQMYNGQPPRAIDPIHEDLPDVWFEQHRQDTIERRANKETQRRVELNRKAEEKEGGFAAKIAAVFDDTKTSIKRAKQEHELKAEDKKFANHNARAKERMTKYFPMHTSERFVCAFDAQVLHNHMPLAGHLILTDKTLCFVGKGQEEVEVAPQDTSALHSNPSNHNNRSGDLSHEKAIKPTHTHRTENILVKEALPLANIASIVMGSVVKNNGKVFILDATDDIVVADALQLFTTDGRIFQFRSFSHTCVTQKGKSYDGRCVPSLYRFLNYLDHKWRAIGGDKTQQQLSSNIPARE